VAVNLPGTVAFLYLPGMRSVWWVVCLFWVGVVNAQSGFEDIIEAERKAFLYSKNSHRADRAGAFDNADVTYQRLSVQVNPAINLYYYSVCSHTGYYRL